MIIFREKEFARSLVDRDNDLVNSSKTFIKELVKYLLLAGSDKITEKHRSHWCDVAATQINKGTGQDIGIKLFLSLIENPNSISIKRYGPDFLVKMRMGCSSASEFIDYIKEVINTERNNSGTVKYKDALKTGATYDNETLLQMLKFVALRLTHQINSNVSWYDSSVILGTKLNWDKRVDITSDELHNILAEITGIY